LSLFFSSSEDLVLLGLGFKVELAKELVFGLHQVHHFYQGEQLLLALEGLLIEVEDYVFIGLLGEASLHFQQIHRVRAHAQKNTSHLFFDSLVGKVD